MQAIDSTKKLYQTISGQDMGTLKPKPYMVSSDTTNPNG
jgi:hypothetical protein